jgi:hypothetical protein
MRDNGLLQGLPRDPIKARTSQFSCRRRSTSIEMNLTLPNVKPLSIQATVPDRDGPVSIQIG